MTELTEATLAELERLERKIESRTLRTDGCWLWTGERQKRDGRPKIYVGGGRSKRKRMFVSRLVWTIAHGEIPSGMCVCHKCDNPRCIRLDHLFLGTVADNNHDRDKKGRGVINPEAAHGHWRSLTHCKNGHELSGSNIYVSKEGWRRCKACSRNWWRKNKGSGIDAYR